MTVTGIAQIIGRGAMSTKENAMTERQRIEALLNRQIPDRVPLWPFVPNGFAVVYNGLTIADAYSNPEGLYQSLRRVATEFGWAFYPVMVYAAYGAWEFGGEVRMPTGQYDQAPVVLRHPIEKDEDIHHLKWPGPDSGFIPTARKFAELARKNDFEDQPFRGTIAAGGAYGLACQVAGLNRMLKWLIRKPDLAHDLVRQISEWTIGGLARQIEAVGTDRIIGTCGGPMGSNQLISAKQFEEFALPDIIEGQGRLRELGIKTTYAHICGEHNDNLPLWARVDLGDPGIVGIGKETALERAAEFFPRDIILGNLDPAIIQTGTASEVYEATKKCVEAGKKLGGRYVFSPGCDLPPKAPVENVRMMCKAVDDHGWY
jgi:uroporphyrinogen decarboxylase